MNQQQVMSSERMNVRIYDFMEYKKKQPFFMKPIKITIGNPINDSYYMVKNVVYKGKQILGLKQEQNPNTIVLVEAKIVDGQLIHISKLPDELLRAISRMLEGTLEGTI
jgi:predicted RNA methylase